MSVRYPHAWNSGAGPAPVPTPIGPMRHGWLFCRQCGMVEAFRWGDYRGQESTIYVLDDAVIATGSRTRSNTPPCPRGSAAWRALRLDAAARQGVAT